MYVTIGCTDGKTYHSDEVADSEIQTMLDDNNGVIGFDDFRQRDIVCNTVEEFADFIFKSATYDTRNDSQYLSLNINGAERRFNAVHIVWIEIHTQS